METKRTSEAATSRGGSGATSSKRVACCALMLIVTNAGGLGWLVAAYFFLFRLDLSIPNKANN